MAIETLKVRAPRNAVITRRDHLHRQILTASVPAAPPAAGATRQRRVPTAKPTA